MRQGSRETAFHRALALNALTGWASGPPSLCVRGTSRRSFFVARVQHPEQSVTSTPQNAYLWRKCLFCFKSWNKSEVSVEALPRHPPSVFCV